MARSAPIRIFNQVLGGSLDDDDGNVPTQRKLTEEERRPYPKHPIMFTKLQAFIECASLKKCALLLFRDAFRLLEEKQKRRIGEMGIGAVSPADTKRLCLLSQNVQCSTLWHKAATVGRVECLALFVAFVSHYIPLLFGSSINVDEEDASQAQLCNSNPLIRLLVNTEDSKQRTPLCCALVEEELDCAAYLVALGADTQHIKVHQLLNRAQAKGKASYEPLKTLLGKGPSEGHKQRLLVQEKKAKKLLGTVWEDVDVPKLTMSKGKERV